MAETRGFSRRGLLHTAAGTALGLSVAERAQALTEDAAEASGSGRLGIVFPICCLPICCI